ncbi:hypothetical protein SBOR_7294 [Sclerotinia borealis F-4128]|uniref:Mid2 domain-containing protein n=1 Tax=Sclerotinia borealis (strain F-4128) TaxID=1432307 RepID=W9C949_SCLBF|nr:hypothetical protein SBOR_7294 [Sclerotinia borealis F-4128]
MTDATSALIIESQVLVTAYNSTETVKLKFLGGSPCWVDLKPNSTGGLGANSPHFNVDQIKLATPTTWGLDTTTTATSTSTPTGSSNNNDATTTSNPTPSSNASSNDNPESTSTTTSSNTKTPKSTLSPGAKVGIGIAIGLAVLFTLAAAYFFNRRRKQARNNEYTVYEQGPDEKIPVDNNSSASTADYSQVAPMENIAYEMYAPERQYEMSGMRPVGELSGDGEGGKSRGMGGLGMDGTGTSTGTGAVLSPISPASPASPTLGEGKGSKT